MTYEIRVDCPSCEVEGTRIELWDSESPSCRLGVPASARCRLCLQAAEGRVDGVVTPAFGDGCPGCGTPLDDATRESRRCPACATEARLVEIRPPSRLEDAEALERALTRWAQEEGLRSARDLVEAYFVATSVPEIFAALARGERVETTFDVADYLFSGGGAGGAATAGPAVMREEEAAPPTERRPRTSLLPLGGPREELLALAAVAAADGEASPDDLAALARAAEKRQQQQLPPHEIRVWRPNEIPAPPTLPDRERVLEEMFQIAWSDGQMDESELRVIRDFSRAWGIDPERLREWIELYSFGDQNRVERLFRRIGYFLFPAR